MLFVDGQTRGCGERGVGCVEDERGERASVGDESEGVREHGKRDEGEEGYRASARVVAGGFAH